MDERDRSARLMLSLAESIGVADGRYGGDAKTDATAGKTIRSDARRKTDADAHSTGDLDYIRQGIGQARRGWLAAGDVVDTRSWADLKKLLVRN